MVKIKGLSLDFIWGEEEHEPFTLIILDNEESFIIPFLYLRMQQLNIQDILIPKNWSSSSNFEKLTPQTSRLLMKRFNLILSAKESEVYGIVILNPYIHHFSKILSQVKNLLRKNKKKYFMFTMNKINEEKLKNFPEIDTYIVISCPKSSLYDYKEFHKVKNCA